MIRSAPAFAVLAAAAVALALGTGESIRLPAPAMAQTTYDSEIETGQGKLEDLKRQAQEKRKLARDFAKKEENVLARMAKVEEALAATRKYVRRLGERQVALAEDIRRGGSELTWARTELQSRWRELAQRLRYSYKYGKARSLEVLFSAQAFPDILQRSAFLNRILNQDRELISKVRDREADVARKLTRLEEKNRELAGLIAEKESEEAQFEDLVTKRSRELSRIRDQKDDHLGAARELEKAAQRMAQVLAELERKREEALSRNNPILTELDRNDFSKNRGKLPWPVKGKVIAGFGRHVHPKYKTETVSNGLDIAAPLGTEVHSVGDGVVDLVQWLPGYGQTVIVNHGRGFYSVYGHLSRVSVRSGDRLSPGGPLGAVGDTGSLKGSCLHFEIREGGTARDPSAWLR